MKITKFLSMTILLGSLNLTDSGYTATRTWGSATSGNFSGAGNQWNTVPGTGDLARFGDSYTSGAAFTVTLVGDVTNQYIRLDNSNAFSITLDLAGHTYTATVNGSSTSGSVIGRDSGNINNALILTSSAANGVFTSNGMYIGRVANSSGRLTIQGADTTVNFQTTTVQVGIAGTGSLEITQGAKLNSSSQVNAGTASGPISEPAGGHGTILVEGSGSTWTATDEIRIGASDRAQGFLTVREGGLLQNTSVGTAGAISFASAAGSSATVLVETGGAITSSNAINIGGRLITAGGTAHVTVGNGGSLNSSHLRIFSAGTLLIDGGNVAVTNLGLADANVSGAIRLTLHGTAPLITSTNVFLNSALSSLTLSLGDGVSYALDDEISLIRYRSDTGALTGTFSNFEEGQIFRLGDYDFQFSYTMGSGANTYMGLTVVGVIPEPNTWMLSLAGLTLLLITRKTAKRFS